MQTLGADPSATFRASLRLNQRKLTRPRRAVLDVITQANRHLTPAEIYRKAKTKHPQLGLTTVYRTLDILLGLGFIQRIHLEDGCHSYAATVREHGHHLVCSACGRAEAFADCDLEPLMKTLQAKTGYTIDVHMLELVGQCPDCQSRSRAPRAKNVKTFARRSS